MVVSATKFQNNFGKYLEISRKENVVVTKNGKRRALLLGYPRNHDGYEAGEPDYGYSTSPRKENRVTYQEFLKLTEESDKRYELIDGVVYMLASPGYTHQRILGDLYSDFRAWFKGHETCVPFLSPFDVDLIRQPIKLEREVTEDDINVVEPDLLVLCDPEKDVDEKDRYKGTPDLVVEILSPSTRSKDLARKLSLYMESGIREFWIVDPDQPTIIVYSFEEYEIVSNAFFRDGERAESMIYPGLDFDVGKLFFE